LDVATDPGAGPRGDRRPAASGGAQREHAGLLPRVRRGRPRRPRDPVHPPRCPPGRVPRDRPGRLGQ
jgi:hypothetical protein